MYGIRGIRQDLASSLNRKLFYEVKGLFMCFSATASFTTALVLVPVGAYCVRKAARLEKAYWLFALIPLMFGIQQFFEGIVWLGLAADNSMAILIAGRGFIFFSHLFWLVWIPLCCYAVEDSATKRSLYFFLAILGTVHGLLMYVPLLINEDWLVVKISDYSIKYKLTLFHEETLPLKIRNLIYGIVVLVPLLSSSDRYIRVFGAMIVFSLVMTSLLFDHVFVSVWCFFAAVLSFYILIMIVRKVMITEVKYMK